MPVRESSVFDEIARSNINSVWGALAVEVLARLGVTQFVISPGSRSTPLTFAAARNPKVEAIPILDERSAGFFALGLAKQSQRPVVLVCTSGSALANYFPAVVEARMSHVPLLLLTADRPPELQFCRAGQTIDQLKLFGDYVTEFQQLALPALDQLAYLRQTLVHAVAKVNHLQRGPAQLNFLFRDPLPPEPEVAPICSEEQLEEAATVLSRGGETVTTISQFDSVAVERLMSHLKGVIVVGQSDEPSRDEAFADAVAMLSHKLGWPVICDVLNPLRNHARENGAIVSSYDFFLRNDGTSERLKPTAILQIGQLPTSKVLRRWIDGTAACSFLLTDSAENTDPLHRVATPLFGSVQSLSEMLPHQKSDDNWLEQWIETDRRASVQIDAAVESEATLFEGKVSWLLSRCAPVGSAVVFANSMSVRYGEFFWTKGDRAISVFCNRGANGIDGTLSSALGVAHRGKSTILLTGDLAFLHDANGLLAAKQFEGSLTVILVNNEGGGIFENLPISKFSDEFENYFATPQSVDFATLCQAHGVEHSLVEDWNRFEEVITGGARAGIRVFELRTDRKADALKLRTIMNSFDDAD